MKRKISIVLAVVMVISITAVTFATDILSPTPKRDNPISNWAMDAVTKASENNIFEENRKYVYGNPITREEFCEMIYNLIHNVEADDIVVIDYALPTEITDTKNVKVLELYARGIINGKTKTEFAPNDTLTREEAATILGRTTEKAIPVPRHMVYYAFEDENEISEWAMNGVQAVCNMGIMKGTDDGIFSPKGTFTVEEATTSFMRIFDTYKANEDIKNDDKILDETTVMSW